MNLFPRKNIFTGGLGKGARRKLNSEGQSSEPGKSYIEQGSGLLWRLSERRADCVVFPDGFRVKRDASPDLPYESPDLPYEIRVRADPGSLDDKTRHGLYAVLDGLPEEMQHSRNIRGESPAADEARIYFQLNELLKRGINGN